jgi:hypothetical protein
MKSYLGGCLVSDSLPTTYSDIKSKKFEIIASVSTCFYWSYIWSLCNPEKLVILYIDIRGALGS